MWWFLPCILGFIRLYLDGVKVLLYQLFNRSFTLPDLPKQNGKVAIVTGGTRGMGFEISRHLVSLDMHVIIAGNEEEEGLAAVKKIQKLNRGKAKRDHFSCHVWTGVFTGRMCESKQKNTNREMFDDCVR